MATLEFTAKCPKCGENWGHGYDRAELAGRLANHEPIETYCSGCDEGSVATYDQRARFLRILRDTARDFE